MITEFEIKYETAASIPPPYCYYYHIKGLVSPNDIKIDFSWVYHNREGLTQEEIEDEGFTGQDDFSWKGNISRIWLPLMEELLKNSRTTTKTDTNDQPFLELTFKTQKNVIFQGCPDSIWNWEYFLQEFIQGIYETSGKEAPLLIRYKKIAAQSTLFCSLKIQFKDRSVSIQTRLNDAKMQQKSGNWDEMKELLELIFSLSFISEKAEKREPHLQGSYIDIGENLWYELGKVALNPSLKVNTIAQVEQHINKIVKSR
ncbi:hypothetical protein [Xanthocytophaga flava]|uniref:hypothetical protein n=1 Tax=Xanthocytophaga flava TaxID=3048013 RepID=UPI0028D8AAF7|nr:hypothetical protein [Xanthocytophaga flavus]MDJ1467352.1 hypothetical protein [Xanthocytophaga flavus]